MIDSDRTGRTNPVARFADHLIGAPQRSRVALMLGLAILLSAAAFGVASRSATREHVELSPPLLPAAVQVSPPPARVETEVITIRPSGFEPSEVTRPKGLFAIAVENRSGWSK